MRQQVEGACLRCSVRPLICCPEVEAAVPSKLCACWGSTGARGDGAKAVADVIVLEGPLAEGARSVAHSAIGHLNVPDGAKPVAELVVVQIEIHLSSLPMFVEVGFRRSMLGVLRRVGATGRNVATLTR
jgi:hypothetical protein